MASMSVTPVDATLGAIVLGVDLTRLDRHGWDQIEAAFNQYAVLIFPGQRLNNEQQVEFALRFGPLEKIGDSHGILPFTNAHRDGKTLRDSRDSLMLTMKGNEEWHTDSSYMRVAAKASILSARVLPTSGGQTEWADMRAAYDALPEEMKQRVGHLSARHSYSYSQAKVGQNLGSGDYGASSGADPYRPLVKIHPATGRPSLFIGRHAFGIGGLTAARSERLLHDLLEFACQPPRVYFHEWRVGDVAVWDNRGVLHRVKPWDPHEIRTMIHTRIRGDEATEAAELISGPPVS